MKVGVLALQGDTEAHVAALTQVGAAAAPIRTPEHLADVDGLVLPGGESTTISMLLRSNQLVEPVAARIDGGMPVFGTCAGMILLASEVLDGRSDQVRFGAIDMTVRRNGFGRQLESFEADVPIEGLEPDEFHAVFIRAPVVERVGADVEVLATTEGRPVLCRSGSVLVAAFHPELTGDPRLHDMFCAMVAG